MNKLGIDAKRHWETWLPDRYAQIEDPETFFTQMGEQAEEDIDSLAMDLAGEDPPAETYEQKVARLATARHLARSQVYQDMLRVDPNDEDRISQLMS